MARVLARLEAAHQEAPRGILAFDGDGTLWSGDVGEDFFHAVVKAGAVRDAAAGPLRALARAHGVALEAMDGSAVASQLLRAYEAGAFPEELTFELTSWLCAGWPRDEARTFIAGALGQAGLPRRYHDECRAVLAWARKAGVETFVVSASPRDVVEEAVAPLGIDGAHVLAATADLDAGGTILPSCRRPIPYGEGKPTLLNAHTGGRPLLGAFGDNAFDVALLVGARVPVAVRPKPRLRERAHEVPGLVELVAPTGPVAP